MLVYFAIQCWKQIYQYLDNIFHNNHFFNLKVSHMHPLHKHNVSLCACQAVKNKHWALGIWDDMRVFMDCREYFSAIENCYKISLNTEDVYWMRYKRKTHQHLWKWHHTDANIYYHWSQSIYFVNSQVQAHMPCEVNNYIVTLYRVVIVAINIVSRRTNHAQIIVTLRKDFVLLLLYWWLFSSTKHCSWNMV